MADENTLLALKMAFTFMPQPIEVNRFEYGDCTGQLLRSDPPAIHLIH